jgi:hypothetical protein
VFAVLALLYQSFEMKGEARHGRKAFTCFHLACIPAFFLSTLWTQPPVVFNWLGGSAAMLQVCGVFFLLKDFKANQSKANSLILMILAAFVVKNLLQFASAFPVVAEMAYQYKNFVIAYLHLVLLGFVSLYIFTMVRQTALVILGIRLFLVSFVLTEILLVFFAFFSYYSIPVPYYNESLFIASLLFPVGLFMMIVSLKRHRLLKAV